MKQVPVDFGQNLIDLAMQEYGCYQGVFEILKLNSGLSLTSEITAGQVVNVHDVVPQLTATNQAVVAQYAINATRINSSYVAAPAEVVGFYNTNFYNTNFYN